MISFQVISHEYKDYLGQYDYDLNDVLFSQNPEANFLLFSSQSFMLEVMNEKLFLLQPGGNIYVNDKIVAPTAVLKIGDILSCESFKIKIIRFEYIPIQNLKAELNSRMDKIIETRPQLVELIQKIRGKNAL